jgi:alpha-galactosidase/6-phospho-beta-glucosidase family protein
MKVAIVGAGSTYTPEAPTDDAEIWVDEEALA